MFNEFDNNMKETQEKLDQLTIAEDPESAVLEDEFSETAETVEGANEADGLTLTPEESAVYQDCAAESIQQMLEQYALDDQEMLQILEARADATETKEDDGQTSLRIEGGSSCGSGRGCSGSTWCYGCGDLK